MDIRTARDDLAITTAMLRLVIFTDKRLAINKYVVAAFGALKGVRTTSNCMDTRIANACRTKPINKHIIRSIDHRPRANMRTYATAMGIAGNKGKV